MDAIGAQGVTQGRGQHRPADSAIAGLAAVPGGLDGLGSPLLMATQTPVAVGPTTHDRAIVLLYPNRLAILTPLPTPADAAATHELQLLLAIEHTVQVKIKTGAFEVVITGLVITGASDAGQGASQGSPHSPIPQRERERERDPLF